MGSKSEQKMIIFVEASVWFNFSSIFDLILEKLNKKWNQKWLKNEQKMSTVNDPIVEYWKVLYKQQKVTKTISN